MPLSGLRELVGQDRDGDPEQRRQDLGAEQPLVALVVRVGDERDAGRHELGPCRLDLDGWPVAGRRWRNASRW